MEKAGEDPSFTEIKGMHLENSTHWADATGFAFIMSGFVLIGAILIDREGSALLQNVSVLMDAVSGGTWVALFMASALIIFGVLLRVRWRMHL